MTERSGAATVEDVDYVSGSTRLFAILGDPIEQVRSPEMVTAQLVALGTDAVLVPMHVAAADLDGVVHALKRIRNFGGMVFTIPHKAAALRHCDALGPQGTAVGAVNAVARRADGSWLGEMFDGLGCVAAFAASGHALAERRVTLIGAGGAGSAIAVAVAGEAPAALHVAELDAAKAEALAARVAAVAPALPVTVGPPDLAATDVLINASPVGMLGDARSPVDVAALHPGLVVLDAIVKPETTPLIAAAAALGCPVLRGRDMMRGQVARIAAFFHAGGGDR